MTDEHEIERLLRRYTPADPPASLDARIARLTGARIYAEPRTWPWAAAAAALLALTVGIHASAPRLPRATEESDPAYRDAVTVLSSQFGGDSAARAIAESMLRQEAAERERQQQPMDQR